MKIRIYILIIGFLCSTICLSQDLNFESIIVDNKSYSPVEGAIISIKQLNIKTKSNAEGKFNFTVKNINEPIIGLVEHKQFLPKEFLIEFIDGELSEIKNIQLEATYKEALKRRRITQNENIKRARLLKKRIKENKRRRKQLAQQKPKSQQITADQQTDNAESIKKTETKVDKKVIFSDIQYKYAALLDTPIENLSNNALYVFIDKYYNKTFSEQQNKTSFLESLYKNALNLTIESSLTKLHDSEFTEIFSNKEYLNEGDLLFFNETGNHTLKTTHVGVYLHNNKFVHNLKNGNKGVTISDLNDNNWAAKYMSSGRRINNK